MTQGGELSAFVRRPAPGVSALDLVVEGVHCGTCVATIEKGLRDEDGVRGTRVNLASKRVTVEWSDGAVTPRAIVDRLQALGYPAYPFAAEKLDSIEAGAERRLALCLAVAAAGTALLMAAPVFGGESRLVMTLIALPTVAFAGAPFFASAWRALKARSVNMDVPIALGVVLSTLASVFAEALHAEAYFDSAPMLLMFLLAGRTLDQRMRRKTRGRRHSLAELKPERAVNRFAGEANWSGSDGGGPARRPACCSAPASAFPSTAWSMDGRSEVDQSRHHRRNARPRCGGARDGGLRWRDQLSRRR